MKKTVLLALFGAILCSILSFCTETELPTLPSIDKEVILYSNQADDDLKTLFGEVINEAKESVTIIIYSLTDKTLINTLRKKAESGLNVVVICDPEASSGVERKLGPKVKTYKRTGEGIMHIKALITDQTRVLLGSANMTTQSLRLHGNLVIGLNAPELAAFLQEKASAMIRPGIKREMTERSFHIQDQQLEMWFLPDNKDAIIRVKELIRTAQKTIRVAMFTWTRVDLAEEIIAAHKRGIQVEVALDRNSSNGASSKVAKMLANEGIAVQLNSGPNLLHHKMMLIDDTTLLLGSANWTLAAFEKNNDYFIIIKPLREDHLNTLHQMWHTIGQEAI